MKKVFIICRDKEKEDKRGRGGGIYINNYENIYSFVLENLKFNVCETNIEGNNIYII